MGVHWKDWCWGWNSNTLATWCKELTHLKRYWCWERLKVREGDDRGWDGWMASLTQWMQVWVNSRSWWWTGRPGMPCMACVHGVADRTQLSNWTELNWDSILKSRDITLPTKVCLVKAMVFPVVMYGCESWTIKKAECQRIDAFVLLKVFWIARRSNQSILMEINPEKSWEGLMLSWNSNTLATWCEVLTH